MIRRKRGPHTGRVAFVNEPFPHHIAMKENGEPDHKTRLIWIDETRDGTSGYFKHYEKGDTTHLSRYHKQHVELEVGGDN